VPSGQVGAVSLYARGEKPELASLLVFGMSQLQDQGEVHTGAGDIETADIGGHANAFANAALVPQAILFRYGNKGLKFHVSYLTQQTYEQDLLLGTFKNQDTTEKGINRYKGYDVVPLAGMPDNTIVACISEPGMESNLWVGCNSDQDETGLMLAKKQANSELFFIKGLFKMDTQIGFPDFVVLYTNITA